MIIMVNYSQYYDEILLLSVISLTNCDKISLSSVTSL
jgi:hypothetical protein